MAALTRPAFLVAAALLSGLLQGCSLSSPARDFIQAERARAQVAPEDRIAGGVDPLPIPYSQIAVSIDGGAPGRMVLATMVEAHQQWLAVNGLRLWTHDGRIVASQRLKTDLRRLTMLDRSAASPLDAARAPGETLEALAYAEGEDGARGRVLHLRLTATGQARPVATHRGLRELILVREQVRPEAAQEGWENRYWVAPETMTVEMSVQRLPHSGGHIVMERLYPKLRPSAD